MFQNSKSEIRKSQTETAHTTYFHDSQTLTEFNLNGKGKWIARAPWKEIPKERKRSLQRQQQQQPRNTFLPTQRSQAIGVYDCARILSQAVHEEVERLSIRT